VSSAADLLSRRQLLGLAAAAAAGLGLAGCKAAPRILVVGAGFGGATAAKYLRRHLPKAKITLVDANPSHLTCPFSNTVLAGIHPLSWLDQSFDLLAERHGIDLVIDTVTAIDPAKRHVTTKGGAALPYDRLILAPGIDMKWNAIEGYDEAASRTMPHAMKAGLQTVTLHQQLEAMADGGLVVIAVPGNPYRCPPGPYERASLIAHYLKNHKPRSKILILDAKDSFSKQALFQEGWNHLYPGMIEWVPAGANGRVVRVNPSEGWLETDFDRFAPAVANIIPPQMAGRIAMDAGLADKTGYCPVDPDSFESTQVPLIHVIGDAAQAGEMPKSAFSANSQAKLVAQAIARLEAGERPAPMVAVNTCYSLVSPDYAISIAGVYGAPQGTIVNLPGAGGVSPLGAGDSQRRKEAIYAESWYAAIRQDSWS
jgi:sulfide dehydrogenase [flavocytochrome c] flavoprotein subunit